MPSKTIAAVLMLVVVGCSRDQEGTTFPAPACDPDRFTERVGYYDFASDLEGFFENRPEWQDHPTPGVINDAVFLQRRDRLEFEVPSASMAASEAWKTWRTQLSSSESWKIRADLDLPAAWNTGVDEEHQIGVGLWVGKPGGDTVYEIDFLAVASGERVILAQNIENRHGLEPNYIPAEVPHTRTSLTLDVLYCAEDRSLSVFYDDGVRVDTQPVDEKGLFDWQIGPVFEVGIIGFSEGPSATADFPSVDNWEVLTAAASPTAEESTGSSEMALGVVDAAIAAHGGFEELRAASTWIAQVRRYQRGDSYVVKSYYRPGMVRLADDLGDGKESASVIGDPHCWGMLGPVSIPCSPETRENDRPRVIMEIAVQLFPLRGEEWVLASAGSQSIDGESFDTVTARYLPRDTVAEFKFDPDTNLLHSISVQGVKEEVFGTHLHTFSEYKEYCGVLMPSHNEKSFEGDVWVAEDVLDLECQPVQESFFLRPPQVAEGTFFEGQADSTWLVCAPDSTAIASLPEQQERLHAAVSINELRVTGPTHGRILEDGTVQSCVPVEVEVEAAREYEGLGTELVPDTDLLSIFSLQEFDGSSSLVDRLHAEVQRRKLASTGPVRMLRYDNDGMGLTGELVVELQLPVEKVQLQ